MNCGYRQDEIAPRNVGRIRPGVSFAFLMILLLPPAVIADIDIILSPPVTVISWNGGPTVVEIDLIIQTDQTTPECFSSVDVILHNDPAVLRLLGNDSTNSAYTLFIDGFIPADPDGLNNDIEDGTAYYQAGAIGETAPPSPGALVTTFRFQVLAATTGTVIDFLPTTGGFAATRVFDCNFNQNTGDISSTALVRVIDCSAGGVDTDGDGFPNSCDNCDNASNPDQANGDGDGAGDACDGCPADPNKTAPGVCGCGIADTDTDLDGTPNCNDQCPLDPLKTLPGQCGCGVADTDTDNDGTANCNDGCPTDPNKIAPGLCGCGVADTDTDGDLTPDCDDNCPLDANKIEPGICGCGVADTDSDGDLTPDCDDNCPLDPNKTEPGLCGCGTPDTDSDNDNVPDCDDACLGFDDALDCDKDNTPDGCEEDADSNGTPDDCEADCDMDGTPDDEEPDCNGNLTPDDCEEFSDCNGNDTPDECEADTDTDGTIDDCDNCPALSNPDQFDTDLDGIGDDCDPCPNRILGDVNGDKVFSEDDIELFALVLITKGLGGSDEYCSSDMNGDGFTTALDIQPFLEQLFANP